MSIAEIFVGAVMLGAGLCLGAVVMAGIITCAAAIIFSIVDR